MLYHGLFQDLWLSDLWTSPRRSIVEVQPLICDALVLVDHRAEIVVDCLGRWLVASFVCNSGLLLDPANGRRIRQASLQLILIDCSETRREQF